MCELVLRGCLLKQSAWTKQWRKRYFTLRSSETGGVLSYQRTGESKCIVLGSVTAAAVRRTSINNRTCLSVELAQTYVLAEPGVTIEELAQWAAALARCGAVNHFGSTPARDEEERAAADRKKAEQEASRQVRRDLREAAEEEKREAVTAGAKSMEETARLAAAQAERQAVEKATKEMAKRASRVAAEKETARVAAEKEAARVARVEALLAPAAQREAANQELTSALTATAATNGAASGQPVLPSERSGFDGGKSTNILSPKLALTVEAAASLPAAAPDPPWSACVPPGLVGWLRTCNGFFKSCWTSEAPVPRGAAVVTSTEIDGGEGLARLEHEAARKEAVETVEALAAAQRAWRKAEEEAARHAAEETAARNDTEEVEAARKMERLRRMLPTLITEERLVEMLTSGCQPDWNNSQQARATLEAFKADVGEAMVAAGALSAGEALPASLGAELNQAARRLIMGHVQKEQQREADEKARKEAEAAAAAKAAEAAAAAERVAERYEDARSASRQRAAEAAAKEQQAATAQLERHTSPGSRKCAQTGCDNWAFEYGYCREHLPSTFRVEGRSSAKHHSWETAAYRGKLEESGTFARVDDELARALAEGVICLLDANMLRDGKLKKLARRQELEARGGSFLLPRVAAQALCVGDRRVCFLTHSWRTPVHPDPDGATLAALLGFLHDPLGAHIVGVFVDFCCLHQKPRTPDQDAAFGSALKVMADGCAPPPTCPPGTRPRSQRRPASQILFAARHDGRALLHNPA